MDSRRIVKIAVVVAVVMLLTVGLTLGVEEGAAETYGALSLIPPILAIVLCMVLREPLTALLIAVWSGTIIVNHGNIFTGLTKMGSIMVAQMADSWNASILLFVFIVGGLMSLIFFSGGGHAFVDAVGRRAKTAKWGQFWGWLAGLIVFIDDYANCAWVGNLLRPVEDKLHVSREKFSYIVDSTAAPVSCIAIISTWIGYQVGLIGEALPAGYPEGAYMLFLRGIPYSFYALFAIIMVLLIALTGRDYGPMLAAEYRARTTNQLYREGGRPLSGAVELKVAEKAPRRMVNFIVPVVLLIALSLFFMWLTGGGREAASFSEAISNADAMISILWATIFAWFVALFMYLAQRLGSIGQMMDSFMDGAKMMLYANLILVSAWSIKAICDELGTAPFIVGATAGILSPVVLPLATFVISCIISFCTGTSWGTMGIMVPIVIPLAIAVGTPLPIAIPTVLTGAVFGDHCSPISDTTVMSSTFSGSDHVDHVRTQLPYAITCALVALLCFLLAGIGVPSYVSLIIGVGLLYLILRVMSAREAKRLRITFPLPEWASEKK